MSVPAETISFEPGNTRGWPKTKLQLTFCLNVIQKGMKPLPAALHAGYSKNTAKVKTYAMAESLRPFMVFLQDKKNELAATHYDVTTDRILREMAAIGLQNVKDYIAPVKINNVTRLIGKPVDELTDQQALAVESWIVEEVTTDNGVVLDYRYVLHDKHQGLLNLGRHLGMFSEKLMLDLNMRQSQAQAIDFSALPQDELEQVINMLEGIQEKAAKARAIEGEFQEAG